jgi:hypothetical protein
MNERRLSDQLAEHGFAVVPRAFSRDACADFCEHISKVIIRIASEHVARKRTVFDSWPVLRASRYDVDVIWDMSRAHQVFRDLKQGRTPSVPQEEWEQFVLRLGHGMHYVDDTIDAFVRSAPIASVVHDLIEDPVVLGTAITYKQPRSGVLQFEFHQDSGVLTTTPDSLVLAFVALDDMDEENGCLQVIPGSHRCGLHEQLRLDERAWTPVERDVDEEATKPDAAGAISLPMERGSVVLLHGRTWHGSGANRSERKRRALLVHCISRRSRLASSSFLQEPEEGFRSLPATPGG